MTSDFQKNRTDVKRKKYSKKVIAYFTGVSYHLVYTKFGKDSMTAVQLRNSLVEKINSIDDTAFLKALNVIIDTNQIRQQEFQLNNSQRKSIQISREEIRKGKFISHEDVLKSRLNGSKNNLVKACIG